jgi:hypothetical protein
MAAAGTAEPHQNAPGAEIDPIDDLCERQSSLTMARSSGASIFSKSGSLGPFLSSGPLVLRARECLLQRARAQRTDSEHHPCI